MRLLWGRMASCAAIVNRRARRLAGRPPGPTQLTKLPRKHVFALLLQSVALLAIAMPLCAADSLTEQGVSAFQHGHYVEACRLLQDAVSRDPNDEHARAFLALSARRSRPLRRCHPGAYRAVWRFRRPRPRAAWRPGAGPVPGVARRHGQSRARGGAARSEVSRRCRRALPGRPPAHEGVQRRHPPHVERTPASYRVNQLSAEIFETQNRFAEAAAEYRKAIQKNPQALNLHFRLGRAILLESHDPEALAAARKEFEAELALNAG